MAGFKERSGASSQEYPPSGSLQRRQAPRLLIPFGSPVRAGGAEFSWDSQTAINGHMAFCGPSGTGKSYQLIRVMDLLAKQGARIRVVDIHGDLQCSAPSCTVKFSEQTRYGLPPLEVLDDPDVGGVRRRANSFINLLERQGALGPRQKTALFRLIVDLYAKYGFRIDDARSWSLDYDPRSDQVLVPKRHPTLADLKAHLWERLVMMKTGQTAPAVRAFDRVLATARQRARLRGKKLKGADNDEQLDAIEVQLEKARADAEIAFVEGMSAIDNGTELEELILWDSADSVQSLYDRIEALERAGIFRGTPPPFDPKVSVWRYDLTSLTDDEQQLFVDCLLEREYVEAKQRGHADGPDTFIVIDEAHKFVVDDGDHILNRLVKEARKFGVGLILASQSFVHFSDDLLMSSSVRLVLGCPEMYREPMRRKLGLEMIKPRVGKPVNPLASLRPKETALVSITASGEARPMMEITLSRF
jgi:DNA helicase HerA-like ATPase